MLLIASLHSVELFLSMLQDSIQIYSKPRQRASWQRLMIFSYLGPWVVRFRGRALDGISIPIQLCERMTCCGGLARSESFKILIMVFMRCMIAQNEQSGSGKVSSKGLK